jgi:hypothetical protein
MATLLYQTADSGTRPNDELVNPATDNALADNPLADLNNLYHLSGSAVVRSDRPAPDMATASRSFRWAD